jgi:hypothetical protein
MPDLSCYRTCEFADRTLSGLSCEVQFENRYSFDSRNSFTLKEPGQEGIMLGGLLFVVCVILQFHYHDPIPWYIWVLALIAQLVAFGEPAMRSALASKKS